MGTKLIAQPDAGWTAMFLGEGLDPVDGASRAASAKASIAAAPKLTG